MRLIFRGGFLALVAVFAIGVAGAASASAAECPGTGEGVVLCSGGHVQEGTFAFTGKQVGSKEIEISGLGKEECGSAVSKGQLVATKTSVEVKNLVIEWPNCKVVGHAGCKVNPIIFDGSKGTGSGPGLLGTLSSTSALTLFSPERSEQLAEIVIKGCELAAEYPISGRQKCKLPTSTTESVTHEIVCEKSGSELKEHTLPVTLSLTERIELTSKQAFSLQRS